MLEFKNVTKKYLRRTALDDVSFTLDDGRVIEVRDFPGFAEKVENKW